MIEADYSKDSQNFLAQKTLRVTLWQFPLQLYVRQLSRLSKDTIGDVRAELAINQNRCCVAAKLMKDFIAALTAVVGSAAILSVEAEFVEHR